MITPTDNLQDAINALSDSGGGIINLTGGIFNLSANLVVPSNINLQGIGSAGTVIDFGGGAYQLKISGTNIYNTGTVAISNGGTTVLGTTTVWDASMIGQSIFLFTPMGDSFYEIIDVVDAGTITIGTPFTGTALVTELYVICDTVDSTKLEGFSVQNSSIDLIDIRYAVTTTLRDISCYDGGASGINIFMVETYYWESSLVYNCLTGITADTLPGATFTNSFLQNITSGGGFVFTKVTNTTFTSMATDTIVGDAMSFVNCSNLGIEDFSITNVTGNGLVLDGCFAMGVLDYYISTCSGIGFWIKTSSDGNSSSCGFIKSNG